MRKWQLNRINVGHRRDRKKTSIFQFNFALFSGSFGFALHMRFRVEHTCESTQDSTLYNKMPRYATPYRAI